MKLKALVFVCAFTASTANADIWGVEDAMLIAKATEQLTVLHEQLQKLKDTYETASAQYSATQAILDKARAQAQSIDDLVQRNSGHVGFGTLNNSLSDLKRLQWSADSWQDTLNGKNNSIQYEKLLAAYKARQATLNKKGVSKDSAKQYDETAQVNQAAAVQSEYAFNEVNASLKRVHELSLAIEKADSTKAAVDLNSRLLTELAYLQTQNIKAQSLANQQMAQKQTLALSGQAQNSELLAFDDDY